MEDVFKTTDRLNRFDDRGREILNPTPMQPPLGYKKTLSLAEQIRQQVRIQKALEDMEPETEDEADDFEIEDDPAPESRWENDMVPSLKTIKERGRILQEAIEREQAEGRKVAAPRPAAEPPATPLSPNPEE